MLFEGIAGRFVQNAAGLLALSLTGMGSVRVAYGVEAEGDEATRLGYRFHGQAVAFYSGSLLAPTFTNSHLALFNPPQSNTTAFIDSVVMYNAAGSAIAIDNILYVCLLGPSNVLSVPNIFLSAVPIANCNPVSARTSKMIIATTMSVAGTGMDTIQSWTPIGVDRPSASIPTAQFELGNRDLRGKICVPPGCAASFLVLGTTSFQWTGWLMWREYPADYE